MRCGRWAADRFFDPDPLCWAPGRFGYALRSPHSHWFARPPLCGGSPRANVLAQSAPREVFWGRNEFRPKMIPLSSRLRARTLLRARFDLFKGLTFFTACGAGDGQPLKFPRSFLSASHTAPAAYHTREAGISPGAAEIPLLPTKISPREACGEKTRRLYLGSKRSDG